MNPIRNPFITSGYISSEYFCDRKKESEILVELLINDNNVSLLSVPKMGKADLDPKVRKIKQREVDETIQTVVAVKSKEIKDHYNELTLSFAKNFGINFRVFDNGVAYCFETNKKGEILIENEQVDIKLSDDNVIFFPEETSLYSHYERDYIQKRVSELKKGSFASLPMLVKANKGIKIGVTEANVLDYPNLFLASDGELRLRGKFPRVIAASTPHGDRGIKNIQEESFIAKTKGKRDFPWRVFMISKTDKELVENQMVYLLSDDCKIKETSWIKPGLVAWDWWNANNVYGVDFKSGINNETYKYYILNSTHKCN